MHVLVPIVKANGLPTSWGIRWGGKERTMTYGYLHTHGWWSTNSRLSSIMAASDPAHANRRRLYGLSGDRKKLPWRLFFCGPFFINDSAFSTTRAGRRSTLLHRSLLLADLLVTTVLHEIKTRFGHFLDLLLTWTAAASVINYLWVNLLWQTNCKFKSAFMLFGRNWTRAWFNHYFV